MSHDNDLQKAVLAELSWEPSVIAAHIGVTANEGVVTLTGHVESYAEKHAAETAARRVRGRQGRRRGDRGSTVVRCPAERHRDRGGGDRASSVGWFRPA